MKNHQSPESRYPFYIFCGVLVIVGSIIARAALQEDLGFTPSSQARESEGVIEREAGPFRAIEQNADLLESVGREHNTRSLEEFYGRRAYSGAPPVIPHSVSANAAEGTRSCLSCHGNGGYSAQFKAFAPVTPHPQLESCTQCHVPQKQRTLFRENQWVSTSRTRLNREAMAGAPPPIPHGLQMRENCIACHGGPGSVREIRTQHPERANCRQCHVETQDTTEFMRTGQDQEVKP